MGHTGTIEGAHDDLFGIHKRGTVYRDFIQILVRRADKYRLPFFSQCTVALGLNVYISETIEGVVHADAIGEFCNFFNGVSLLGVEKVGGG